MLSDIYYFGACSELLIQGEVPIQNTYIFMCNIKCSKYFTTLKYANVFYVSIFDFRPMPAAFSLDSDINFGGLHREKGEPSDHNDV